MTKRKTMALLAALMIVLCPVCGQKKQSATKPKATTQQTTKGKQTQGKGKTTTAGKNSKGTSNTKGKGKQKQPTYTNSEIKRLQNERSEVQKKLKEQQQLLNANKADVKKKLDNLLTLNSEIQEYQKDIDNIQQDIGHLDGNIELLQTQLKTLEEQLKERQLKYMKSMRYLARNRNIQDKMMFVFSANNFAQMYRRMRFARDYSAFQRAQGEEVKAKQQQIEAKKKELQGVKTKKNNLLYKGKKTQESLQAKEQEQKKAVDDLQRQQKNIQGLINEQQKKAARLNAEIDRLVAIEVEKARQRAAEEARRKAAEAEAAKKKRQEELARKKAEAEKAARENERRVAEARAREAKAKADAEAAKKKSAEESAKAERKARQLQAEREAAERKAKADRTRHDKDVAKAEKESEEGMRVSTDDRKLSSNFESNRGRLPMPITGSYRIVSHYGQYNVEGLKNVTLDNKGINIMGQPGAQARAIFNGEVSAVFSFDGSHVVMVRHGSYISVYCNLKSVSVHNGQKVSTRQALGTVGADNILQFQLRRETAKLNPEAWLGR